jgi:predicted nucleotidyltransferase
MKVLKNIFTSRTRVKILTLFFTNPDTEFYLREIARKLDENTNAVRRELNNLEKISVLKSRSKGNMKYYAVNREMPIYKELKSIVLKMGGVSGMLITRLNKLGNIKLAFIYGSFARDEETSESDIDLFVVGDVDEKELLKNIRPLEDMLSREINYALFSEDEFKKRIKKKDPFITNLMKAEKITIIGDVNEYR